MRRQFVDGNEDQATEPFAQSATRADQIEATAGHEAGESFFKLATGHLTPLNEFLDE